MTKYCDKCGADLPPGHPLNQEERHKYWCEVCEGHFFAEGKVEKCPDCGGKKFGIDEPIIRTPKQ